jgi:F-type H+-transporting ATPase subunit epsilon
MKPLFDLHIITPADVKIINNVSFFRAEDKTGSFGILPRHIEFLSILEPSIAIAFIEDREEYFAFNGAILSFKNNLLIVTTKEFAQSNKIGELKEIIEVLFKEQQEKESTFHLNMQNLRKAFFKKIIELEREIE